MYANSRLPELGAVFILFTFCWAIKMENIQISDVNLTICSSSNEQSSKTVTLKLTQKFLRTCAHPIIPEINASLKHAKLNANESLENRLASESRKIKSNLKKCVGGSNRLKFDKKVKSITIQNDEFELNALTTPCTPKRPPLKVNDISTPEATIGTPKVGVRLDNAGSRSHKKRIEKQLQNNTTKALDFVETYGVIPQKVVCETFTGEQCVINVDGMCRSKKSYENMTVSEKKVVKEMMSLCDQNMISDASYHEIAHRFPDMPRKSHIVSCRNEINSEYSVMRTPGMLPGSYLNFKEELSREINLLKDRITPNEPLKIKVSGDGAKVSKVSNFVTVSFTILIDSSTQTHTDQKVLAIVNCDENYDNLKKCFGPLFDEINVLSTAGEIIVADSTHKVEVMVGGDMKFIQLLLGLNGSIATYACPWCKVTKDNRGDMTLPEGHYHTPEMLRSIKEITELAKSGRTGKQSYGVTGKPLLNVEPVRYVPDELHLLMRITDILLRNLISDARAKDEYGRINGQSSDNVDLLVKAIQSCGLAFKIWTSKSGEMEWTSLSGNDKKKLLLELPDKLLFCIHEDTRERVVFLWKEFSRIYSALCSGDDADLLFDKARTFVQHFVEIGKSNRLGYHPCNVTPYMHVLVYHVPYFVKCYGGLCQFSGQGVEKTNDVIKQVHQMRSSKIDPTVDALLVRKRIERSKMYSCRKPRQYKKLDDGYWSSGILSQRNAKKIRIREEMQEVNDLYHGQLHESVPETLTVEEMKTRLTELGVKTRFRKKEKLLELLREVSR